MHRSQYHPFTLPVSARGAAVVVGVTSFTQGEYQGRYVDLIIRIKPFRLVLGSIADRDNQGEVTVSPGLIIKGLDNQA
jgi:hypothetical protein